MAALEVLALDEATPQLRAPAVGDTYTMPRPLAITGVAGTAALSITGGTQTTDVNFLNLTGTWNDAGVTFTGIKANITSTASASGSLLMDLQVGGTSYFSISKTGQITNASNIIVAGGGYFDGAVGIRIRNNSGQIGLGASPDVYLARDAANTLALRNSTNAQEARVYGTYSSATQYHYVAVKTAKTTLTATAGATITATDLIPDGAFLIGVTTRVNTTCTTATGYTVGDGSDVDLWGVASAVAAGTATSSADFTAAGACGLYTAAQSVVITATGGNFDGTGAIEVVAHYLTTMAD